MDALSAVGAPQATILRPRRGCGTSPRSATLLANPQFLRLRRDTHLHKMGCFLI